MFPNLFVNLAIILIFIFLQWKSVIRLRKINSSKLLTTLFVGLTSGLIGALLMLHSVNLAHHMFIDLRHVVIALTVLYGSPLSTIICVSIIGATGFVFYGFGSTSLAIFSITLLTGIVFSYVGTLKKTKEFKYIIMNLISAIYLLGHVLFSLKVNTAYVHTYISFLFLYIVGAFISYCECEYLRISHENYKRLSYYKLMVNNSSDLIISFDSNAIIKYLSPSVLPLLGYSPLELVGTSIYNYLHPKEIPYIMEQHKLLLKTSKTIVAEIRIRQKSGNYIWFETSAHCIKDENCTIKELLAVSRDITARKVMEKQLKEANLKLTEANEKLKELSFTDSLTGVSNRRYFEICIKRDWRRTQRTFKPISLLVIDIDYFKTYNDTYGHLQGDECLKIVSETLRENIKRGGDLLARLGGEEFVVILPDTDEIGAINVANNLRTSIEKLKIPNKRSKTLPYITISIGVACIIPTLSNSYLDLIHWTDVALYNAKHKGRNRVELYNNTLNMDNYKHDLSPKEIV
ncbi:diguanylate cyclase [Clostridium sp.]|uniref:diguanylate cyclase n=1 Tax=Clostridium sp. TaxID=1506 RepID=UPI002FC6CF3B